MGDHEYDAWVADLMFGHRARCDCGWRGPIEPSRVLAQASADAHIDDMRRGL